jgi:hypothetical protein
VKKLAIISGSIVAVIVLAGLLLPRLAWDGAAHIQFRFHVVESDSTRPIKDAMVRIIQDSRLQFLSDTNLAEMFPITKSDGSGMATVSVMCGAGGSKGLFGKTGGFIISHELLVEADGYRPLSNSLANVVGGRSWPLSKRVFDVELVLFKNP